MIHLRRVGKYYTTRTGNVGVLRDVDLKILKGQRLGILGRNGSGKSTLIRIISGAERPTFGHVRRSMSVSWPLAFSGAFQTSLTGLDNLRFICRIYNVDYETKTEFVADFSELGRYLKEPVRIYSSGMRARLAFAISMAVDFDCFLIDEIIAVGDSRFHAKCLHELFVNRSDRAMVFVSHDANFISSHCDSAAVLAGGTLSSFASVGDAQDHYSRT